MNFKEILLLAKENDNYAITQISNMYNPLLIKESIIAGIFDEDLYSELSIALLRCIKKFRV